MNLQTIMQFKHRRWLASLMFLSVTTLIVIATTHRLPITAASRQLTIADTGSSITLAPNDFLTVTLVDNPTTGYLWALDQVDLRVLAPQRDDFEQGGSNAPGSPGVRRLSFKAIQVGNTKLQLKRWRSSEGASAIVARFAVLVQVQ